jgi:short subunit dehydrogenase-like uncharacterized protein
MLLPRTHTPTLTRRLAASHDCLGARSGYWSTSRMILEAGLALALDADKIAATGECRAGGVLTPASAAGMVLLERLRGAGLTFRVDGA